MKHFKNGFLKKTAKLVSSVCLLAFAACSEEATVENVLEAPVLVAKSRDTAAFERGIRAWPGSSLYPGRGIRVEWHSFKNAPVGGYSVYRTSMTDDHGMPEKFLKIATVEAGQNAEDTVYIDQNVEEGKRYFYKIAAFQRTGSKAEGNKSEPADFTLSSAVHGVSPASAAVLPYSSDIVFRWEVANGTIGYSVLRLFEVNPVNNAIRMPVWVYSGYPSFTDPSFTFPQDGNSGILKKGKTYGWYITQIVPGERNHGSASRMKIFSVE